MKSKEEGEKKENKIKGHQHQIEGSFATHATK
jgi:hypothetical protein